MRLRNSFFLGFTFISFFAQAQTIRIDRIKGNKAIVDINSGSLKVGDTYDLSGGNNGSSADKSSEDMGAAVRMKAGGRSRLVALSGSLASMSVSAGGASTSSSTFSFSGRYGWNFTHNEYGFLGYFSTLSSGGISTTSLLGGGFYDVNLVPNKSSEEMAIGVGGEAGIGSATTSVAGVGGASSSANTTWYIYPSGFAKWFLFKTSTCIRGDLGLLFQTIQSSPAATITGVMGRLALAHYF